MTTTRWIILVVVVLLHHPHDHPCLQGDKSHVEELDPFHCHSEGSHGNVGRS